MHTTISPLEGARLRSLLDACIEGVRQGLHYLEPDRVWMKRIQEEIRGVRHDRAWHLKQNTLIFAKPLRAQFPRDVQLLLPILPEIVDRDEINRDIGSFDFEQGEVGWNIIGGAVYANLQERRRWALAEIHDGLT